MTTFRLDPYQEGRGAPKQKKYGGPIWYKDPEKADLDIDVERVVLDIVNNTRALKDLDISQIIIDGEIFQTMDGASTITLTLHDPEMELLNTGIFDRAIDVEIDGLWWRLVAVTKHDDYLDLVFEDRIVAWLKAKRRPIRRSSRNDLTRLEFCLSLVRAARKRKPRIPVVCPELTKRQAIARTEDEKEEVKERTSGGLNIDEDRPIFEERPRGPQGLPGPGGTARIRVGTRPGITVKGVRATAQQIRVLEGVLRMGADMDVSKKMLIAAIEVVIQESLAGKLNVSVSGNHVGPFHQDKRPGSIWRRRGGAIPGNSNRAVRGGAKAFFIAAKLLDTRFMTAEELAEKVQVAGTPSAWGQWRKEAEKIVSSFSASDTLESSPERTYRKRYTFTTEDTSTRKPKNYWTAIKDLLDEVRFACFTSNGVLYMISEDQLMRSKKRMIISPRTPGVNDVDFTVDTDQELSSATVSARVTRWIAPPGTVVQLVRCGPASNDGGRWLVESIRRSLFARDAEIVLKKRTPHLKEPAPEVGVRADSGRGGPVGETPSSEDLFDICKHISDVTPGYLYGGGHGKKLSTLNPGRDRLDCSSSSSLALYRARMFGHSTAQVSGWFAANYGKKGRGKEFTVWANGGHMFIQSEGQGRKWRFDTGGPGGGRGPKVHFNHRSTTGFTPRYWPEEEDGGVTVRPRSSTIPRRPSRGPQGLPG